VVYPPEVLDGLQAVTAGPWQGTAYRHMFSAHPPDTENTRGARWNPPNTAAIYVSLLRDGALAEAEHALAVQPLRPRATRTLYEVRISLTDVLDLQDRALLASLGVDDHELGADDMTACQQVGGAAAWLGHDGILVPSARSDATNLVIYPTNSSNLEFEVTDSEPL
jgi:RES domain-containing protein